ncbi:MAG: Ppx/GppA family phosphatase [Trueperaceae bacterium]|nr:Ppx/GppA family phosphatase [Trueperaceae bacterium]
MPEERIAIIDLGSNTARLVVFAYEAKKHYQLVDELREVVRLSEGMGEGKIIRADAYERALQTLVSFKTYCDAAGIAKIRATATSAVREAQNGESFLRSARERAGLELELLPGDAEARMGTLAVANSLPYPDAIIFDIGGGSLEVSLMQGRKFVKAASWPLGAVTATEQFLQHDPVKKKEVKALLKETRSQAEGFFADLPKELPVIGIGGTIRNLADVQKKRENYVLDILHDYVLKKSDLAEIVEDLVEKTVVEKRDISGLNSDRADIITAGGIVVLEALEFSGAAEMIISGMGLREGLFFTELMPDEPHLLDDVRGFSIANLAQRYYDRPAHNEHVKVLSLKLFDELCSLHQYGDWERELLGHAALIHDIGMAVNYYDHHKHGLFLVMSAALPGFSHREQALIGLLCRYHRKGSPSSQGYDALLQEDDMARLGKLAALLRLAEYLERSKSQRIKDLRCHIGEGFVQIEALAQGDAYIELREANDRKDLFAEAYGVKVEVILGHLA